MHITQEFWYRGWLVKRSTVKCRLLAAHHTDHVLSSTVLALFFIFSVHLQQPQPWESTAYMMRCRLPSE